MNPINELAFDGDDAVRLLHPPREWFDHQLPVGGPVGFTVDDQGRVFGHIGLFGSCHTGIKNRCQDVPRSRSGYAAFHGEVPDLPNFGQGVICSDGEKLATGHVFFDTDHGDRYADAGRVIDHYGHSGLCGANVRAFETEHGVAVVGAVSPNITRGQLFALRSLKVSGHWSELGGSLEMLGIISVNQPGFNLSPIHASGSDEPMTHQGWHAIVASGKVVSLVGSTSKAECMAAMAAQVSEFGTRLLEVERQLAGEPSADEIMAARVAAAEAALGLPTVDDRLAAAEAALGLIDA